VPQPRKFSDSHDPWSTPSSTYSPTEHLMRPHPPTWPQRHQRGSDTRIQSYFYCPSRDGQRKAATIPAMTSTVRPSYPGTSGAQPYPFPVDPHPAPFRPSLDRHQVNRETTTRTSTTGSRTSAAALQMSRRPVTNITTTPQRWPARTGARRRSNTNSAHFAFFQGTS
jgi:hypothetical protein